MTLLPSQTSPPSSTDSDPDVLNFAAAGALGSRTCQRPGNKNLPYWSLVKVKCERTAKRKIYCKL